MRSECVWSRYVLHLVDTQKGHKVGPETHWLWPGLGERHKAKRKRFGGASREGLG